MARKISDQQERFVWEYLDDPIHPGEAAKRAGYRRGSHERAARALLDNPKIQERIAELRQVNSALNHFGPDETIARLIEMANVNIGDYISWNQEGIKVIDSEKLKRAQKANLVRVTDTVTPQGDRLFRIEIPNTLYALDKLCKIHGLYKDRVALTIEQELENMSDDELMEQLLDVLKKPELKKYVDRILNTSKLK